MGPQLVLPTPDQSGPDSNGNEDLLHTLQGFKIGTSPPDAVLCQTQDTPLWGGVLFLCREYSLCILNPTDRTNHLY